MNFTKIYLFLGQSHLPCCCQCLYLGLPGPHSIVLRCNIFMFRTFFFSFLNYIWLEEMLISQWFISFWNWQAHVGLPGKGEGTSSGQAVLRRCSCRCGLLKLWTCVDSYCILQSNSRDNLGDWMERVVVTTTAKASSALYAARKNGYIF